MLYESMCLGHQNGAKCTTTQMHWLDDILVTNPMRDAMIEFLKATLSAGFRTKKLHFSCIKNYKELKNHHFFTNPTDLTY